MSVAVVATGLGRRYGSNWALRDCSLSVPGGSVVGLVGPNGAGKSSLIRLAVGLSAPSTGAIRVFGADPYKGGPQALARIGYVAQDHPLYARFRVADLLRMGRALNLRWDDQLAHSRLESLSIPTNRRAGTLSGGQQAQVALALALGKRPDLLILDEPVASLDPLARREFMAVLMDAAAADGLTVLISSHVVSELERVCDHLIALSRSRVQVAGDVDTLLQQHRRLVGPYSDKSLPGVATVIRASHTDKQSSLIARVNGPIDHPHWRADPLTLEELVLAYLAEPDAGTLPGPTLPSTKTGAHR